MANLNNTWHFLALLCPPLLLCDISLFKIVVFETYRLKTVKWVRKKVSFEENFGSWRNLFNTSKTLKPLKSELKTWYFVNLSPESDTYYLNDP